MDTVVGLLNALGRMDSSSYTYTYALGQAHETQA